MNDISINLIKSIYTDVTTKYILKNLKFLIYFNYEFKFILRTYSNNYTFLIEYFIHDDVYYFCLTYNPLCSRDKKYIKINKHQLSFSYFHKLLKFYEDKYFVPRISYHGDIDTYLPRYRRIESYLVVTQFDKLSMLYKVHDLFFLNEIYDLNEVYDSDIFGFILGHNKLN